MNIILTTGILLIVLSLLTEKKDTPYIGFAFVLLIMGFQSGVEGDFMGYMQEYNGIAGSQMVDSRTIEDEPVFPYLMKFFSYFAPYWLFVLLLSMFEVFVVERFVARFSFGHYQFLAAILFFFSFNMMLMQMKAMRQGFAIEMMLLSVLLIEYGKKLKFPWLAVLAVVAAFFTHNSAAVAIPFVILFYFAKRNPQFLTRRGNGDLFPVIMVGIYLFVYFIKTTILNDYLIGFAMMSDEDFRLASYFGEDEMENAFKISWLIVLYDAVMVFLISWYYRFADSKMRVFCWASIVAAFGDMLFFGIGSLPRIIMYLVVFNLVVYPAVTLQISRKFGKVWALIFIVFLFGYAFKTSLPWMLGTEDGRFGTYEFVFMP